VILIFSIFIFLAAAFFLSIEIALCSILTYFTASKMIDFLLCGLEEYTVVIVSEKSKGIKQALIKDLKRSVTVYKGSGGLRARSRISFTAS
jgi:uncharacterized membrane-anchored protein YitT (DUF2179 family)